MLTCVGVISAFGGGVPLVMIVVAFIKFYPFTFLTKCHYKLCADIPYIILLGGNDGCGSTIVPVFNIHNKSTNCTKRPINSNPGKEKVVAVTILLPLNVDARVVKVVGTDVVHVHKVEVTSIYKNIIKWLLVGYIIQVKEQLSSPISLVVMEHIPIFPLEVIAVCVTHVTGIAHELVVNHDG